jgi:hypothetical protein
MIALATGRIMRLLVLLRLRAGSARLAGAVVCCEELVGHSVPCHSAYLSQSVICGVCGVACVVWRVWCGVCGA